MGASGGTYGHGHRIAVRVEFDRAVTVTGVPHWPRRNPRFRAYRAVEVTGVPQIAVIIGTKARWARFLASLDSETGLYFCYTVQPDDRGNDGISIPADSLSLNGGAITLAGDAETAAVLTHAAVDGYWRVDGGVTAVEAVLQTSPPAGRGPASGRLRRGYSFVTASPARIVPERTTLAYTPRSRRCLPMGVLMNFRASNP